MNKSYIVWSVMVAVGVCNNSKPGEVISVSENPTRFHTIPSVPDSESVPEKVLGSSRNPKLNLKFPIAGSNRLKL